MNALKTDITIVGNRYEQAPPARPNGPQRLERVK